MQYDKYGDPIQEANTELSGKQKTALGIMVGVLLLLCAFNILVLAVSFLNTYMVFLTAPIFLFLYIAFLKIGTARKENGAKSPGMKVISVLCPIVYAITAILAIFAG